MNQRSATEIAADVRTGARSATSVLDEAFATIDARNEELNVFLHLTRDEAYAQAREIDAAVARGDDPGPLAGVPLAVKDIFCTKGVPTTCASRILENWVPPYDATTIIKARQAGAIMVGKTNMDEFAMGSSNENSAFGPVRNPLNTAKVPGGSSGGSAAAVASGMTPLAFGTDTGGSIRQPSALCGTVGIKPTYGRVSRYGVVPFASSLDQVGPMASNVRDAAALLGVIAGHDPADSTSINAPVDDYLAALDEGVEGQRIGVIREMFGEGLAPDVERQVRLAAESLRQRGAIVDEVSVPTILQALSAYYILAPAEASSNLARFDGVRYGLRIERDGLDDMYAATRAAGFGPEVKRRIMLGTYVLSSGYYDAYYAKAQKVRRLLMNDFARAYEHFDLLLAPTSPITAFDIGEKTNDIMAMYRVDVCTLPANLAGQAAMSVPFGSGDDGMPVGVQLLAPALGESAMLRAAQQLEDAAREIAK